MGNATSAPIAAPPPPQAPTPVATLPLQRVPTLDGASGLQYSGRVYTNEFAALSSDICNGASVSLRQIKEIMPNSLSTTTLPVDDSTKRISQSALQGYVSNLQGTGAIPGEMPTFDEQTKADKKFYDHVQREYCFYETRYQAALKEFLARVSNPAGVSQTDLQNILDTTTGLNQRLNSLLEIINYVGNERARRVAGRNPKLQEANTQLEKRMAILQQQQELLTTGGGRIRTQEEQLRYSAEKSHAMNIQIMFFVALNVVALGTVLTVYRSLGGGGVPPAP
jgi:hypothetical protein